MKVHEDRRVPAKEILEASRGKATTSIVPQERNDMARGGNAIVLIALCVALWPMGLQLSAAPTAEGGCRTNTVSGLTVPSPTFCNYFDVLMDIGPTFDLGRAEVVDGWMANAWLVGNFGRELDDVVMAGQRILGGRSSEPSAWVKMSIRALKNNGDGTFGEYSTFFAPNTDASQFLCAYMTGADYLGTGRLGFMCSNEGIDTFPFPGEASQLFVPSVSGYAPARVDNLPRYGQGHGAASGVIDETGRQSIFSVVVGSRQDRSAPPQPSYFLLNDGGGSFSYNTNRLPHDLVEKWPSGEHMTRRFSAGALIDTTGTGVADLVVGMAHDDPAYPSYDSQWRPVRFHSSVYMNPGDGDFSKAEKIDLPEGCFGDATEVIAIAAADLDGKGVPYLILAQARVQRPTTGRYIGNCIQILKRNDSGYEDVTRQLVPEALDQQSKADHRVTVMDVNGDRMLDIVVQAWSDGSQARFEGATPTNSTYVLLNNGRGTFSVLGQRFWPQFPYYNEALIPIDLQRNGQVSFLAPYDTYKNGRHLRKFALWKWKANIPTGVTPAVSSGPALQRVAGF